VVASPRYELLLTVVDANVPDNELPDPPEPSKIVKVASE